MKTFLIELQKRPDGVVNQTITSYSTKQVTLATFHQRAAAALGSTQFLSVTLIVIDELGNVLENENFETSYVPEV